MPLNYDKVHFTFKGYENSPFDVAEAVILPVPYEATTSYIPGTRFGPRAILTASADMEMYEPEFKCDLMDCIKVHTAPELFPTLASHEETINQIKEVVDQINKFFIMLGGEHSITLGAIKAMKETCPDVSVLHLDAHADMKDTYQDTKYSHTCVMRRIRENNVKTVSVGIRALSKEEQEYMDREEIKNYDFTDEAITALSDHVYITLDMDIFPPELCPGVGTPEPGGPSYEEVIDFLRKVFRSKNVVGVDIVETRPVRDNTLTEDVAARICYKMLGWKLLKQ